MYSGLTPSPQPQQAHSVWVSCWHKSFQILDAAWLCKASRAGGWLRVWGNFAVCCSVSRFYSGLTYIHEFAAATNYKLIIRSTNVLMWHCLQTFAARCCARQPEMLLLSCCRAASHLPLTIIYSTTKLARSQSARARARQTQREWYVCTCMEKFRSSFSFRVFNGQQNSTHFVSSLTSVNFPC